mmetsp:Transcript_17281/g.65871  ORF Transcript_17281/g.65871 Transcript_17281/m.65871 type:complete len:226 (+) Transcript_17281:393-1070(+)
MWRPHGKGRLATTVRGAPASCRRGDGASERCHSKRPGGAHHPCGSLRGAHLSDSLNWSCWASCEALLRADGRSECHGRLSEKLDGSAVLSAPRHEFGRHPHRGDGVHDRRLLQGTGDAGLSHWRIWWNCGRAHSGDYEARWLAPAVDPSERDSGREWAGRWGESRSKWQADDPCKESSCEQRRRLDDIQACSERRSPRIRRGDGQALGWGRQAVQELHARARWDR